MEEVKMELMEAGGASIPPQEGAPVQLRPDPLWLVFGEDGGYQGYGLSSC